MLSTTTLKPLAVGTLLPALIAVFYTFSLPGNTPANADDASPAKAPTSTVAAPSSLPDFSRIVEENGPAVVNITSARSAAATERAPGTVPENDPLYEYFKRFGPPQGQGEPPVQRGQGSGFIISSDGLILTNAHVLGEGAEITVKLTDKREFTARVIGVDKRSDTAVLKIDAANLPVVRIGDPAALKVGEWVAAIGSPFGFENTITSGIVSAKARTLPNENYVPFIQTDAAVNPGNSGGPLFNMKGEVVGINSQIFSRTGGFMGLSFAIPIDVAMNIKTQLVANGKVTRGRIGVQIQEINQALANSFGLPKTQGALISVVEPGSPAADAGLKSGDVVLSVNGSEIDQLAELSSKVAAIRPGDTARLRIWRDGGPKDINVKVGELPEQQVAVATPATGGDAAGLGLTVRELAPAERAQLKAESGLLVQSAAGAAARAGIQPGDVILSLNNTPVSSARQMMELVKGSEKSVALLIQREDTRIFIPVPLG